jgi:hypothetical protein
MSQEEMRGLKYGLHRSGFKPLEIKTIKLLVGMEVCSVNESSLFQCNFFVQVELADKIGYPLLERITGGPSNPHLTYITARCPGAVVTLCGKGTVNPVSILCFGNCDCRSLIRSAVALFCLVFFSDE